MYLRGLFFSKNQYFYDDLFLERVGRIELPSVAWEATVLPLYDTRDLFK